MSEGQVDPRSAVPGLSIDPNDRTKELLTLVFPAGTIAATLGSAEHVQRQLDMQIADIKRRLLLQKYADMPIEKLEKADAAAQAEFAKE
jgi:hypothetical protein